MDNNELLTRVVAAIHESNDAMKLYIDDAIGQSETEIKLTIEQLGVRLTALKSARA
jgi:hypothetical protein